MVNAVTKSGVLNCISFSLPIVVMTSLATRKSHLTVQQRYNLQRGWDTDAYYDLRR